MSTSHHVLITGAARGIGAAIAHTLAQADMHLTLLGRDASVLQALAESLPGQGRKQVVCADVSDAAAMQHAVQAAVQTSLRACWPKK